MPVLCEKHLVSWTTPDGVNNDTMCSFMRARKSAAQGQRVVINKIPISITSKGVGGGAATREKAGRVLEAEKEGAGCPSHSVSLSR